MSQPSLIILAGSLAFILATADVAVADDGDPKVPNVQVAQAPKPGKGPGGGGPRAPGPKGGGPKTGASKGADCSSAGSKAAAQTGGKVLSVSGSGGACSVTVLVPGKGGGRPRKTTVTIRP